jgi:hypothetical protein
MYYVHFTNKSCEKVKNNCIYWPKDEAVSFEIRMVWIDINGTVYTERCRNLVNPITQEA